MEQILSMEGIPVVYGYDWMDRRGIDMRRFQADRYYRTTAPELELVGTRDALAKQRSRGEGPRYHKIGRRVVYLGRDLNEYLDACVVEPTTRRAGFGAPAGPGEVGRADEPAAD